MEKNQHLIALGKNIRDKRKAKGLSQEQFAFRANIDRSYFGGIERGERNVSFLTLIKISKCLGCDVATLTIGIPDD